MEFRVFSGVFSRPRHVSLPRAGHRPPAKPELYSPDVTRPVSHNRWLFAQESQRRHQERKRARIGGSEEGILHAAERHSALVWNWLRSRQPRFSPSVVAEVGSGAHGLIWRWPGSAHRIAVDPLASFYRERFGFLQASTRDIVQAAGEALPLSDGSIDLILSDNVLDHVQDPLAFMQELGRVVASDGLIYLTTHFSHPFWWLAAQAYNQLHSLGLKLWVPAFPSHPFSFRKRDILALVNRAGLEIVAREGKPPSLGARRAAARRLRDWPKLVVFKDATIRLLLRKRL